MRHGVVELAFMCNMKRKGPPYIIEHGTEGDAPPAYVRSIRQGKIILSGELDKLDIECEIDFPSNGKFEENTDLIRLILDLNSKGVVFSYDYKVMISPAGLMTNLQDLGILKKSFKEISWRNPKSWLLTTYEIE